MRATANPPPQRYEEFQSISNWNMTTLTTNTFYTVFDETNCRVIKLTAYHDEAGDFTGYIRVTVDGVVSIVTIGVLLKTGIKHYMYLKMSAGTLLVACEATEEDKQLFNLEGKDIQIEFAVTTPTAGKTYDVDAIWCKT